MDQEYISEHNVIERYLAGRLTDEERAAFEERCLWCSDTLQELEVAERLREGLRDVATPADTVAERGLLARWLLSPQWAAAASVMLVVSLATTGWLLTQTHDPDAALATTQVYSIEMTRSGETLPVVVRIGPDDRWVVLLVYPELGRHDGYRAELYRRGEAPPVWQASGIPPGSSDSLALTLPAPLLSPGDYRLGVLGLNDGAPGDVVGEVSFRVAAAE